MQPLIDVPPGLNNVAVAETEIGSVDGDAGFYHYREYDAVELARSRSLEDVWHLLSLGALPDPRERARWHAELVAARSVPEQLFGLIDAVAATSAAPLAQLRTVLSASAPALGLRPLLDLSHAERRAQATRLAATVPGVLARLYRSSRGRAPVEPDPRAGHAAAYLQGVTGKPVGEVAARALEQYLILTVDHGFNASTFTGRVVAATRAPPGDGGCRALGARAGPPHRGAPRPARDALDAIGTPDRAAAWVRREVAAGRRIMGFGHAVYRAPDPRSGLLREVAESLGGELVERAIAIETEILTTLAELKPDRPLPSNVEFYAGVIMATVGLPPEMFTPTFAVSRAIGWVTHAVEQAAANKLIRPSAHYVGPPVGRAAVPATT